MNVQRPIPVSSILMSMCIGMLVFTEKSVRKKNTHVHLSLYTYIICPKTKMQAVKHISSNSFASKKFLF